jgi:benzil reductase ((S)-benzoin forming)
VSTNHKIALVTGTSSGIGAAVARTLLDRGWSVVGMSRARAEFDSSHYRHFNVDLADLDQLKGIAQEKLTPLLRDGNWGRIGLVNNAGAVGGLRALEEMDPLQVAGVFAVNAVAPIFLMGLVVRTAPPATKIRIVNLSSGAAVHPAPGLSDYGSSKAALRIAGMTMAAELESPERAGRPRPDMAILSYSPGVVDTPMQEKARSPDHPWSQRFMDFYQSGRLEPPEAPAKEIAEFLEGDDGEAFMERRFGSA